MNQHDLTVNRVQPLTIKQLDCNDLMHNPIRSLHTGPGMYKHICPNCGKVTFFTIPTERVERGL